MIWWIIPAVATLAAWLWTRRAGAATPGVRVRPAPGSPEDVADLARFAAALRRALPDRRG